MVAPGRGRGGQTRRDETRGDSLPSWPGWSIWALSSEADGSPQWAVGAAKSACLRARLPPPRCASRLVKGSLSKGSRPSPVDVADGLLASPRHAAFTLPSCALVLELCASPGADATAQPRRLAHLETGHRPPPRCSPSASVSTRSAAAGLACLALPRALVNSPSVLDHQQRRLAAPAIVFPMRSSSRRLG